jgi:GABA permease
MKGTPTHRLLVIANETVEGATLHDVIRRRTAGRRAEVIVVAPALNSRLRHWVSDSDHARDAAQERLDRSLERLERAAIHASGWVGDADPMRAIADTLRVWEADELVIATHPEARSNWLARRLPERARDEFALPVTHVVVDLAAQREYLVAA